MPIIKPIYVWKYFQKEKLFTAWHGLQQRKAGNFYYKISDQSAGLKPADVIWADFSGLWLVEAKIIDGYTFNINEFQDQQITALNLVWDLCQRSKVLIYSKKTQEYVDILWGDFLVLLNGKTSVELFEKSARVISG